MTSALCGAPREFPSDRFAGVGRAVVFCEKPKGHTGGHEATKRAVSFAWSARPCNGPRDCIGLPKGCDVCMPGEYFEGDAS